MNSLDKRTVWEYVVMAFKVLWVMYTSYEVIEGVSDGDNFMVALSLFFMGLGVGALTFLKGWFKDSFMESEATSITMGESIEQYAHEDGKIHGRRVRTVPPNYKLWWASIFITTFLVALEATMGMFTSTGYSTELLDKRVTSSLEYISLDNQAKSGEKANSDFLEAQSNYKELKFAHESRCDRNWGENFKTKRDECYKEFEMPVPKQSDIKVNTSVNPNDVKQIKEDKKNIVLDFALPLLFIFVLSLLEFVENTMSNARLNRFKDNAKKAQEANGTNSFLASAKEMEFDNITTDAVVAKREVLAKNKLKRAEAEKRAREIEERADKILIDEHPSESIRETLKKSKDNVSGLSTAKKGTTTAQSKEEVEDFWNNEIDIMLKEDVTPPKSNIFDSSPALKIEKSEDELLAEKIKNFVIKNGEMIDVQEGMLSGEYLKLPKNDDLAQLLNMSSSSCDRKVKSLIMGGLLDIVTVGAGNKTARILIP